MDLLGPDLGLFHPMAQKKFFTVCEKAWTMRTAKPTMITDLRRNRRGMPPGSGEPSNTR